MKLVLVCLYTIFTLTFGNVVDLEFKKSGETGSINHFAASELSSNDETPEKRRRVPYFPPNNCGDTCQSGYQGSKYCRTYAVHCFGRNGQNIYIRFSRPFRRTPKVMIGLTLVDTHKDQNVRVRASVSSVSRLGFFLKFKPWDRSITYQIGVNWMACP